MYVYLRWYLADGDAKEEVLQVRDWEVVPNLPVGDDIIEPSDFFETFEVLLILVLRRSHALVMLPEGPFVQSQLRSQDLIEFLLWLLSLSWVTPYTPSLPLAPNFSPQFPRAQPRGSPH